MNEDILKLVREKGLLLERSIFEILDNFSDIRMAGVFLDNLERASGQKMITTSSLTRNFEFVSEVVKDLPGDTRSSVEKTFVKLGISLEVKKEISDRLKINDVNGAREGMDYRVFYSTHDNTKKIEVSDFTGHFRARYQEIQKMLMHRPGMDKLISINKISSKRDNFTIIGIVSDKRVTKNKNYIIKFEDLTGTINALVKFGSESFKDADELQLDDIVAVRCSGNNELLFAHEIIYPDAFIDNKVMFDEDFSIAFVSDVHAGSKKHLREEFRRFVDWLNSDDETARKIKYIFFVGDNVDGVGVFPGQEGLLELTSLRDQYELLGSYLKKVPERITMFMCPGQHDSVRVPEPQPVIDKYYGEALYSIPNLVLVSNPSMVKLYEGDKEFKILMYHGASIHSLINNISELRLMKAHRTPAKAVKHMLKRRHLAPQHSQVVYVPNAEKDPLVISEVPDVFCTGEVHRLDIERHNGVLIITGSCWQAQTDFEEKVGNVPDPCKVPILNLKSSELKILDFGNEGVDYGGAV